MKKERCEFMNDKGSTFLFNTISSVYGLFYGKQKRWFKNVIETAKKELDIKQYKTIIDVGCGTGALCSVLSEIGLEVTGVDAAIKMLNVGKSKQENNKVKFINASIIDDIQFKDKSFDISISSYVAHGLNKQERKDMYLQMKRISKEYVIMFDYNDSRALLTDIVEFMEGGDYFNFIKNAKEEMEEIFDEVRVINVDIRSAWYVCSVKA